MGQTAVEQDRATTTLLIAAISVIGLCALAYALYQVVISPLNFDWLLLSIVTVLSLSSIDTRISRTPKIFHALDIIIFISVLLYGPLHSVVLAGADAAVRSISQKNKRATIPFNVAAAALSVFASGTLISFAFGDATNHEWGSAALVTAAVAQVLLHYALKSGILCTESVIKNGDTFQRAWREMFLWSESFRWAAPSYFISAAIVCLSVNVINTASFSTFLIAMLMAVTTYTTYKVYLDKEDVRNQHAEEMADLNLRTIEALAIAIDAKDEVTHDHVYRVQIYAIGMARIFGLSDLEVEALRAGAVLHDIGKLAVPDYILNKPGKLTSAEFDKMKVHTVVGAEILERVGFHYPVVPIVRHHHERWDGRGYPDGLRGEQIPITARIISVVDCFDAVREDRQYRKAMTRSEAIELLLSNKGTMYDPVVVDRFIEHLPEFEAEIRRHKMSLQPDDKAKKSGPIQPQVADPGQNALEQIRNAHREVTTLYDIAQTISGSLDLRDTFAVFSSRLQDIINYTTCVLYLVRPDSTDVEAAHVGGRNAEAIKGRRMASGAGISGWVIANGHPMHNSDPQLDFDMMKAPIRERYRTATVVPLLNEEKAIGALALYSADLNSYDTDHLRLLEGVAKLASDAISRPARQEKSERSATIDLLTGLPNARALRYRFEVEADRARRHRDNFAVVMIDIDSFKGINDQMSPQIGDRLLKEVSKVLSTLFRSSDFIGRYSGDKFVALLQVSHDEVGELVRRIQATIERQSFEVADASISIGVNIGWSCFGIDGDTLDELLLAAYQPMCADKSNRKTSPLRSEYQKDYSLTEYKVM